jgi:alpha-D-xyloside xylohydrolase
MITAEGKRLIYHFDHEKLYIEPWGENSLRVRCIHSAGLPPENWALLPPEPAEAAVSGGEITNGRITARVDAHGRLTFLDRHGSVILEEYHRNLKGWDHNARAELFTSSLGMSGREFQPVSGGDWSLTARFEADDDEKLYGMGQYQQPYLNIKGCEFELLQRNTQASVPFVLSSKGYGFLWNNPAQGHAVFGKGGTTWRAQSAKVLDYWITAGDTPYEIMEAYGKATGFTPMMPEYAMGFWQCKLRYQTQDELLNVAREYKRRGIPLSVIVADFFHWPLQGDWKFDPEYWPDPEGMVRELREMGVELMVSVWPTVDQRSENYWEMLSKGYLIRTERGERIMHSWMGNTVFIDATNPAAREFAWSKFKDNYYSKGIRIFWLDESEPEYLAFGNLRYHIGSDVQTGNIYPAMYARAFYDGMTAEGQKDVINLVRCAWAGSQRYGALVWSGDVDSSFRSFRNQFAAGLNMGLSGIPWWTTDIGGFRNCDIRDPKFVELLIRWFQYGTFCPVMRLHGDREPHTPPLREDGTKKGGGAFGSGAPNEVWSYGEEAEDVFVKYIRLRESMKGYITKIMREAHERGTPVMRTLFFEFPNDPRAWEIEDAYMFGPDVLVAPVMHGGSREREVYLPDGAEWTCAWTGDVLRGGQTVSANAPIEVIPYYFKNGSSF